MHTLGVIILIAAILFVVIPSRTSVGEAMERRTTMTKLLKAIKIIAKTFAFGIAIIIIFALAAPDTPEEAAIKAARAAFEEKQQAKDNFDARLIAVAVQSVRSNLRNPDSLDIRQAILTEDKAVCMTYAAQNGFGGMNVERAAIMAGVAFDYNEVCSGKTGADKTSLARRY